MITTILIIVLVALTAFAPCYIVCSVKGCYGFEDAEDDEVDFHRFPLFFGIMYVAHYGLENAHFISLFTYYRIMQEINDFLASVKDKMTE